jgi:hypothetical protein
VASKRAIAIQDFVAGDAAPVKRRSGRRGERLVLMENRVSLFFAKTLSLLNDPTKLNGCECAGVCMGIHTKQGKKV